MVQDFLLNRGILPKKLSPFLITVCYRLLQSRPERDEVSRLLRPSPSKDIGSLFRVFSTKKATNSCPPDCQTIPARNFASKTG